MHFLLIVLLSFTTHQFISIVYFQRRKKQQNDEKKIMHARLACTFRCYRTPSSRVLRVRAPAPLPLGINTSNNYRTFFLLLYAFNGG